MIKFIKYILVVLTLWSCSGKNNPEPVPAPNPASFSFNTFRVNGAFSGFDYKGINTVPTIKVSFTSPVNQSSVQNSVSLTDEGNVAVSLSIAYENQDSTLVIKPSAPLAYLSKYALNISTSLKSKAGGSLLSSVSANFLTAIDSTSKFPAIPDDSLLTLIQKQTFKYFWDFGHPASGMARERNTSGDIVTTGGSGFGIMAIPVAIERKFITRAEGLARLQTVVEFLKNKAPRFHGAFSHWMNGSTGEVIPFGVNDNGADIVETSYLMMGLLTARQYFSNSTPEETQLRDDINSLYDDMDWTWFQKNGENVLYWNWSPDAGFAVNVPVMGWNECLITYVMAASSPTHPIPKEVYDNGFARNGAMVNNNTYYGYRLPLGSTLGGPLFFEQYSFLGINPNGLSDTYANYHEQTVNHSKINFEYCKANPNQHFGYSSQCWGLTASDIQGGYNASSPTSDLGVIAPTAAVSAIAYTPEESLQTIRFFYYQLGDKIWGDYGFKDAFNLNDIWFADSYLAIDQGPQIGMIENYRTGLLWRLFMSCPEIQDGLKKLGFSISP